MPASRRSSVDLPAPLWPTSPTRAPWSRSRVTSCSAWMTGTRSSLEMLPPTMPRTVFFSDRVLALKMGKSTDASCVAMLTTEVVPLCPGSSDPVGHARPVAPHDHESERPAHHGDRQDDQPVPKVLVVAEHGRTDDLEEVQERVEFGDARALGDARVGAGEQVPVDPRSEEHTSELQSPCNL